MPNPLLSRRYCHCFVFYDCDRGLSSSILVERPQTCNCGFAFVKFCCSSQRCNYSQGHRHYNRYRQHYRRRKCMASSQRNLCYFVQLMAHTMKFCNKKYQGYVYISTNIRNQKTINSILLKMHHFATHVANIYRSNENRVFHKFCTY